MRSTTESLEVINRRLKERYGNFEGTSESNYRLSWVNDLTEKRLCNETKEGWQLLTPELREEKKYSYMKDIYILEKLFPVPTGTDLVEPLSYECIWAFNDKNGNYLEPVWQTIEIIISVIHENMNQLGARLPYKAPEETIEGKKAQIDLLEQQLFGDETKLGDALATDRAVGYGVRQRNDDRFRNN